MASSGSKQKRGRPSTPPPPATPEWRSALSGREEEFVGIALIAVGLVLGLGIYLRLAGPLGRAVDDVLGWLVGWGRFVLPVAAVAVGVALVRRGASAHRIRLVFAWTVVVVGVLGLLHITRGPRELSTRLDDIADAGGVVGGLVGEPTRSLIGVWGAGVVFLAVTAAGVLLVTGRTAMEGLRAIGAVGRFLSGPVFGGLRSTFGRLSTLSSDPDTDRSSDGVYVDDGTGNGLVLVDRSEAEGREISWSATERAEPTGGSDGSSQGRRANDRSDGPVLYDLAAEADGATPTDGDTAPPRPGSDSAEPAKRPRRKAVPVDAAGPSEQTELDLGPGAKKGSWALPAQKLLHRSSNQALDMDEVLRRGKVLEESLSSHGVDTRLVGATAGPTVTRYELELGPGVKVARVTSLQRDIAYAMAATDVRILAPIPGKSAIGVEVPNQSRQLVALADVLFSAESKAASHPLDVAVGKDIAGRGVFLNLATTPHLLIAGATGAGKSSGINCIITSLLMRTTPDQVRLILIDPKQVEMNQYAKLPHLLTQPVTNPKKAANALSWAVREMERRYDLLMEFGFRDITGYNGAYDKGELVAPPGTGEDSEAPRIERLPYIVVVVDELNDLMMVAARDVEESITRIAQKARAVGIHLIVATQRPSVNVITGVIKANIPARMAFAVSSLTDSRVILDQPGAEKLVGKGDMLLLPGNSSVAQRIQGAWVDEEEVRSVANHWKRQAPEVSYVSGVDADGPTGSSGESAITAAPSDDDDDEGLVRAAMELVVRSQLGSTSMLQRKLKVGFARAGRIMDLLEQRGVVGPSEGSKARAVLMTLEEFELLQTREG